MYMSKYLMKYRLKFNVCSLRTCLVPKNFAKFFRFTVTSNFVAHA